MKLSLIASTAITLIGIPVYLVLDRFGLLLPALRDRPWPLDLFVLGATIATIAFGRHLSWTVSLPTSSIGVASFVALLVVAHGTHYQLPRSAKEIATGKPLPDAALKDASGRPFSFLMLRGEPTVVLFYLGGWCPVCRAQLAALGAEAQPYVDAGIHVVGISRDSPSDAARSQRELGLPFPLLSDEHQHLASDQCGGVDHCQIVADPLGNIRWGGLNDNWRVETPPRIVLQAAYRLRDR
jgi:peroxiredoxin